MADGMTETASAARARLRQEMQHRWEALPKDARMAHDVLFDAVGIMFDVAADALAKMARQVVHDIEPPAT